jgi:hypothetical protein
METALEILKMLSKDGDRIGNKRMNRLYEATTAGVGDWTTFIIELRKNDEFPRASMLGWLQNVSSSTFVSGPSLGNESIFTPAIRSDRVMFRAFLSTLLGAMTGAGCMDILPLYEALVCAIGETRDMREVKASIAGILGLTRQAGEALDSVMLPLFLKDEVSLGGQDLQKIQKQQMANFHIGLRSSTRLLRELAASDAGYDDGYWAKTAEMI